MASYTYADTEVWLNDIANLIKAYPETEQNLIPLYERVEQMQRNLTDRQATRERIAKRLSERKGNS